jgi:hypothetical protein
MRTLGKIADSMRVEQTASVKLTPCDSCSTPQPLYRLALARAALWVRSYLTADQIWAGGYLVASEFGAVYVTPIARDPDCPLQDSFDAGALGMMEREWSDDVRRARPVRFIRNVGRLPTPTLLVIVADWFAVLAFAALPAYRLARRVRRRSKPGHCPK